MKLLQKIPNVSKTELARINKLTRENICLEIRDKLLYLEKYSTSSDKNKMTYVMIPSNHPVYQFPYNLEDRVKYKLEQVFKIIGYKVDNTVSKKKDKDNNLFYEINIKNNKDVSKFANDFEKIDFNLIKDGENYIPEIKITDSVKLVMITIRYKTKPLTEFYMTKPKWIRRERMMYTFKNVIQKIIQVFKNNIMANKFVVTQEKEAKRIGSAL